MMNSLVVVGRRCVIDLRMVDRPEHHFFEEFNVYPIDKVNVGFFTDNLLTVIDNHLTAGETPTQLYRCKMKRFSADVTRIDNCSHGKLVAHSEI